MIFVTATRAFLHAYVTVCLPFVPVVHDVSGRRRINEAGHHEALNGLQRGRLFDAQTEGHLPGRRQHSTRNRDISEGHELHPVPEERRAKVLKLEVVEYI